MNHYETQVTYNNIITAFHSNNPPKHQNHLIENHLQENKNNLAKINSTIDSNAFTPQYNLFSSSNQNNHIHSHFNDSLVLKENLSTQNYAFSKKSQILQTIHKESEAESGTEQDKSEEMPSIIQQNITKNMQTYCKIHMRLMNKISFIRNKYFTKLIITDYWLPFTDRPHYNSIIIFDWDDTLFPTTYLKNRAELHQDHRTNELLNRKIKKLELSVKTLLSSAINKGNTFIITNAELNWVKFTTGKFYPMLLPLMNQIKIISAREQYQMNYPGNDRMWKIMSFMNIVKNYNCNKVTNIVCIGDSPIELEASKKLSSHFSQVCMKCIKFKALPRIQEVLMQVKTVIKQFDYIYSAVKNWTIRVEKKNR